MPRDRPAGTMIKAEREISRKHQFVLQAGRLPPASPLATTQLSNATASGLPRVFLARPESMLNQHRRRSMNYLKLAILSAGALAAFVITVSTQTVVDVDGHSSVAVLRAPGDNLADITRTEVHFGTRIALAGCASWDIVENCCPAGCAAQKGSNWPRADDILRGCMRGLGCSEDDVKNATVFMKCDCDK
jgi:hypothetical protein